MDTFLGQSMCQRKNVEETLTSKLWVCGSVMLHEVGMVFKTQEKHTDQQSFLLCPG